MRCLLAALLLFLPANVPVNPQVFDFVNLDRLNQKLQGKVVDYTQNHGADRRIVSPILGRPRDLYVYLPPGYDPSVAYSLKMAFSSFARRTEALAICFLRIGSARSR
jgi:hypothetical protein